MHTQALAVNGARVYIVGRTAEKLERVAELYGKDIAGQIIPITADITSKDSIKALVKEIGSREDHLSILVNNAGIAGNYQSVVHEDVNELRKSLFDNENSTFEDWATYRTNVCQLYFLTTAFLPLLLKGTEKEYGWSSTVINTSSISGIVKVAQDHFSYNTSKAAAVHLTKMLAHEISVCKIKIRVNSIAPGVFPSEMTAFSSDDKQKSTLLKEDYKDLVPAGRAGHERDMGSAILFLATNQYMNGQIIAVDGGYILAAGAVST
jgi:NAD(P)-dependent dehydrogenase (short-subunit alcohol dehydrogenase family)